MLVRCVTLSLDRFENQVDMKGEEAKVPMQMAAASSQELCAWGQEGGLDLAQLCQLLHWFASFN